MRDGQSVAVIIPAFNEERSIGRVIQAIPDWVDDIIVVDNASSDDTARVARDAGARVVAESERGYGAACLRGIASLDAPGAVVFLDGDFSDHPEEMDTLVDPILAGTADLVVGSRTRGRLSPGALTLQARFGNVLACSLVRAFWGVKYSDLGPFRAVRYSALRELRMRDRDYGWTIEMQVQAALLGLRICEVPVSYRKRIGVSKISGTIRGVIGAGTKILGTIFASAARSIVWRRRGPVRRERLIVFSRYPQAGMTKTRMIPALGPEGASELQRSMTEHTLASARRLAAARDVVLEVSYAGGSAGKIADWLGAGAVWSSQGAGDLGTKMRRAFARAFDAGARSAVIVGTDCPALNDDTMARAFDDLRRSDLVLGPAVDGGYYLIGLALAAWEKASACLFEDVAWGTSAVLEQTLETARTNGLSYSLLERLDDVDRPEDLDVWNVARRESLEVTISAIVPALNEEGLIAGAVDSLLGSSTEVIVVDGGSSDQTAEIARARGAVVLRSSPGRGVQMNAGAAAASGEVLLFVHADTRLPGDFRAQIAETLSRPGVVAGAFRFAVDSEDERFNSLEWLVNWRTTRFHLPYGDQGLFTTKRAFVKVGAFSERPLMEDLDIVRRFHNWGRIAIAPGAARTSVRRWEKAGRLGMMTLNQMALWSYVFGVSPSQVARWYLPGSGGE